MTRLSIAASTQAIPIPIEGVVNQRAQFSAIGGPGGTGTWTGLRHASAAVYNIVEGHLEERANGEACTVDGATHFLNPYLSSRSSLKEWGNHVWSNPVAVWGRGRDIHYHGFAPEHAPAALHHHLSGRHDPDLSGRGVAQPPTRPPEVIAPEVAAMVLAEREPPQAMPMGLWPEDSNVAAEALAYRIERLAPADLTELQDSLNSFVEHGWRLRQLISDKRSSLRCSGKLWSNAPRTRGGVPVVVAYHWLGRPVGGLTPAAHSTNATCN